MGIVKSASHSMVSVVIPCYKQSHFLGEAIESVLAQSYGKYEIIVVDDGSPDDVAGVVQRFPDVCCIHQSNQGISAARNAGLAQSRGDYVVFLDSDDRLLPNALAVGVAHLDPFPDRVFVWGQCSHIDASGQPLSSRAKPRIESDFYRRLLETNYIRTPGVVMYRQAVVRRIGGFLAPFRPAEDYELNLRLLHDGKAYCHYETVAEYRIHNESAMRDPSRTVNAFKRTLDVLTAQWPFVRSDAQLRASYFIGRSAWINQYSQRIQEELELNLSSPQVNWFQAWQASFALLRYRPKHWIVALRRLTTRQKALQRRAV